MKKKYMQNLQKFWSNPEDYFPQIINFTKIWFIFFFVFSKINFYTF